MTKSTTIKNNDNYNKNDKIILTKALTIMRSIG